MSWSLETPSVIAFAVAATFGALAFVGWRHRDDRCSGAFVGLAVTFGLWTLSYAFQFGYSTAADQLPFWRLGLVFAAFISPMWVLFGLRYAGKDDWVTPDAILMLFAEPAGFVALLYTNPSHELVWSTTRFLPDGAVATVSPTLEPLYYLHVVYHYGLIAFGSLVVAGAAYHSMGLYRRQAAALVLATVPPVFASLTYTVGTSPTPGLDLTPFAGLTALGAIGLSLYQFDMLDRTPIAREQALAEAGGGLLVLDADGVVVDADDRARRVVDERGLVGRSFEDLFPGTSLETCSGQVVETQDRGGHRFYEIRAARICDDEGEFTGYSVVFRDVTARRAYEQRLEVANRVLRHNLRNDMNLVQGVADRLESGESADVEADARLIRQRANRVVELGEKARVMTRTDPAAGVPGRTLDLVDPATTVLEGFADEEPDARLESALPDSLPAVVADESALVTALRELVENAIDHNDAAEPLVRLEGERSGSSVLLRVVDDGPGVPEAEREVLQSGTETPLHHGQGMGLWLAYWSTQAAGGTLAIEQCTETGSTVVLRFPAPE